MQQLTPGMTLLLDLSVGGYSATVGYTGDPNDRPQPMPIASSFA